MPHINKLNSIAFLWISMVVMLACDSPSKSSPTGSEKQIREARISSNTGIAQHDTAVVANYWTEDYELISSRNAHVSGRIANRDNIAKEFLLKPDVKYVRATSTIEVYEPWGMAAENGTWVGTWTEEEGGKAEITGSYYAKWHRVNGQWLIRAEIFTPLQCSGSFCATNPI